MRWHYPRRACRRMICGRRNERQQRSRRGQRVAWSRWTAKRGLAQTAVGLVVLVAVVVVLAARLAGGHSGSSTPRAAVATATLGPTATPQPPTATAESTTLANDTITRVITRTNYWRQQYAPQCVPLAYNAQLT